MEVHFLSDMNADICSKKVSQQIGKLRISNHTSMIVADKLVRHFIKEKLCYECFVST